MTQQYYFMFSDGSYSDYCVGALCVCDHEVTQEEWEEHLSDYCKKSKEVRNSTVEAWCYNNHAKSDGNYSWGLSVRGTGGNKALDEWRAWRDANDPQESFIKLHNMVWIKYTELHGGN